MRRWSWKFTLAGLSLAATGFAAEDWAGDSLPPSPVARAKVSDTAPKPPAAAKSRPRVGAPSAAELELNNFYKDILDEGETPPSSLNQPTLKRTPVRSTPATEAHSADWVGDSPTRMLKPVTPKAMPTKAVPAKPASKVVAPLAEEDLWEPIEAKASYDAEPTPKAMPARANPPVTRAQLLPAESRDYILPVRALDGRSMPAKAGTSPIAAAPVAAISIEWVRMTDINVGQESELALVIKNHGATAAKNVEVEASLPNSVRMTHAEPKPIANKDRMGWRIDEIASGAETRIQLRLIPSRRGELPATASVRVVENASATFRVEEPMLKLALSGPEEVLLSEQFTQSAIITNPGTGLAQDVKLLVELVDGLVHSGRQERFTIDVGSISPGESQAVRVPLTAARPGQFAITMVATAGADLSTEETATIVVQAPSLKLAAEGPAIRYKGRAAKYQLVVHNDGTVASNNVRVKHVVPAGFKFVSADRGGRFESSQGAVNWYVGRIEPGERLALNCSLNAEGLGDHMHVFQVASDANQQEERVATRVEGAAALSLEIVDLDDPVEVGSETAYEIRVRNDGSKAATNVTLNCELPAGLEVLTAKGPVDALTEGRMVAFQPLGQIPVGQAAIFRVHVRGLQAGNHRLRARLTSDSIQEPLTQEEQTKVYLDQ